MRRVLLSAAVGLVLVALIVIFGGFTSGPSNPTYKLEFGNAFGLVSGAPFKVAGVPAGSISSINLCYEDKTAHCQNKLDALVTVQVTTKGFGAFRSDASCQSRPQSLIGEYFVDCQPGQYGKALASGATLTSSHTFSTIPADLLADIMRMPQRERFTLIINELGAAVAGRSTDLQTALQRAVPAIDETDNLLNLLGNDSQTLKALTANSNAVITALANNSTQVQNFIVEADKAATDTATQQANLKTSLQRFPGLLEQLKPAMAKLGTAATTNTPVLTNLNAAAGQLHTFFTNLAPCSLPHKGNQCGFANASLPALQSLGQASVTGKTAVEAAAPTVAILNKFAAPTSQGGAGTGELAQNLAIVLADLDDQNRAVEPDSRSPGGKGF
ncbi:MAG: MCE family protein, partial [Solirubrobacterales bacterium]|nr:MCE family protein [Solirubrobacterales bacterium]